MPIDLNAVPSKPAPEKASRVEPSSTTTYSFVDYDLLHVVYKGGDDDEFYGNWRDTADKACADKAVDRWIRRGDMRNYDFARACPGSTNGIWRFTIEQAR